MTSYEEIILVLQLLNIIFIPLGVLLYRFLAKWRLENKERDAAKAQEHNDLRQATLAMMCDKIMKDGEFFCMLGAIPARIKATLLQIGKAYLNLGGNGDGKKMLKKIEALPIDDNILKKLHKLQYNGIDFDKLKWWEKSEG